jgi:uncharacterized protein (TIGR02186 family)
MAVRTLKIIAVTFFIVTLSVTFSPALGQASNENRLVVSPSQIKIGMFYNGLVIDVEATAPQIEHAAILCKGENEDIRLKKKAKVYGILWMSVGKITFHNVPKLYILETTKGFDEKAYSSALDSMHLGYDALRHDFTPERIADNGDINLLSDHLIKLKESEGLFKVIKGGVKIENNGDGRARVTSRLKIPAKVSTGDYQVTLYGFQAGDGEVLASAKLSVKQAGAALFISSLSRNHGLLYGVLAVFIALIAGLATGLIFGLGSKRGH